MASGVLYAMRRDVSPMDAHLNSMMQFCNPHSRGGSMRTRLLFLWSSVSMALLFSSCEQPTEPTGGGGTALPSSLRGVVLSSRDAKPIEGAKVADVRGVPLDTTKSDGSFRLTYNLTSRYSGSIYAQLDSWGNDTVGISLEYGKNDTLLTPLILQWDSTSRAASSLRKVASLILASSGETTNLSVRGTGLQETALLTFEARDSVGDPTSKALVTFTLLGGPGGGEYLFPTAGITDNVGKVTTRVTSGSKAGVLQVQAISKPDTITTVKSSPVRLTISGGLPDSAHFSMNASKYNIAGILYDNLRTSIGVIVGDKDGNPVQAGTAVYFTTTGGLIQPSAVTDKDGGAKVDLISANPRPPGGIVQVTAKTIGDSGKIISKRGNIVFSGFTQITHPANGFIIGDSSFYDFNYTVSDGNGNPLIGRSTVAVTVSGPGSGDLEVLGDASVTIPDAPFNGPGITQFSVRLRDKMRGGASGQVDVLIAVTSDDATGNGSTTSSFSGRSFSTGGGGGGGGYTGGSGLISNLTLSSISPASGSLSVKGTGSNEAAHLTFIARDSSGNPVADPFNPSKKVYVEFSYSPVLGAGEFLFPAADSTDLQGLVGTTFNAGVRSGVFQVTATAKSSLGAVLARAAPVVVTISGGFPDINAFSPTISKVNMPGLVKTGALGTVGVQVGDSAGNPVQAGTKIYFSTTGGLITAQGVTDQDGQAKATLQGGSPIPNNGGPGRGLVTVQTVGKGGASISKQVPFLFSGAPKITAPASGFQIADSGQYNFTFKVADANGNPLSSGTVITVTKDGPGSGDLELKGDINKTMPDTRDTSATKLSVQIFDKTRGGTSGVITLTISVTGDNGAATYSWTGTQLAAGVTVAGTSTGFPSSIQLQTTTATTVSVKGTGNNETLPISWVVRDSIGNPITLARAVTVKFTLQSFPNGGEFLSPDSAVTDAAGKVTTTLNSGTKAGVVQVVATISGSAIKSSPAGLVISGGLPDAAHISMNLSKQNMPGLVKTGRLGTVGVQLGDIYGNPVPAGTAVYFSTDGGVVDASAVTNSSGTVSVGISGGSPVPSNPTIGYGVVSMETGGVSAKLTKTAAFLFSGSPIITGPTSGFQIADSGQYYFTFKVADANGNPLSSGTVITVTKDGPGSGDLELKGDINKTMPDTKDTSATKLSVQAFDKTKGGSSGVITLTISVTGDNGAATYSWTGTQLADGVAVGVGPGGTGYVSSILLSSTSATDISVQGTGSSETATIVFQAKDSMGQNVDQAHGSMTHFTISSPTLGATLAIDSIQTDAAGRVTTLVRSGTIAGVIQVKASVTVSGKTITSLPVRLSINSGLPDSAHFTIGAERLNFPGLRFNGLTDKITIQMGDKHSNPVQPGTVAYFSAPHGIVQTTGSTTSTDGFITKTLFSANPRPEGANITSRGVGFSWVLATTAGPNGRTVKDSVGILWTGPPIIGRVSGFAGFNIAKGGSEGPWVFTVQDLHNHPMSAGTSINVSAFRGTVSGDASINMPDTQSSGAGLTTFTVFVANSDKATDSNPPAASKVVVTVIHPVYGTYSLILDTGIMQ